MREEFWWAKTKTSVTLLSGPAARTPLLSGRTRLS